MARPKKIKESPVEVQVEPEFDRLALVTLLKAKMAICFDPEPRGGMNSNVEKLTDEIINLIK